MQRLEYSATVQRFNLAKHNASATSLARKALAWYPFLFYPWGWQHVYFRWAIIYSVAENVMKPNTELIVEMNNTGCFCVKQMTGHGYYRLFSVIALSLSSLQSISLYYVLYTCMFLHLLFLCIVLPKVLIVRN